MDTWASAPPRRTDNHELLLTLEPSGAVAAHFFTYDLYPIDVNADGIPETIALHAVNRKRSDRVLEVVHDSSSDVQVADAIEGPGLAVVPDLDHMNSLDIDKDGNYILSLRTLGEVDKIDATDGKVLWRLGGVRNQFTFINDAEGGFSAQHCARALPDGNILLYDNGWRHVPQATRVVEYRLDTVAMTATLMWQFRAGFFTKFGGAVQRLASGETLIGWANGLVQRVNSQGQVLYQAQVMSDAQTQAPTYRVLAVPSLYEYQKP